MMRLKLLLAVAVLSVLAACNTPPPLTLDVNPKTGEVSPGGSGIPLTASFVNGTSSDPITWTLEPASGLGTLSGNTGSTITYNPPSSVTKTETVTVKATAGLLSATSTITIKFSGTFVKVVGKAVDIYGRALPNVTIRIGTASDITRTDGTFTIDNVLTPYDVILIHPGIPVFGNDPLPNKNITVYRGLSLDKPQLLALAGVAPINTKNVKGTISSAIAAGEKANVAFGSSNGKGGISLNSTTGSSFTTRVDWEQFESFQSTTGKLFALKFSTKQQNNALVPDVYQGFVSKDTTLNSAQAGDFDAGTLNLTTLNTDVLEGGLNLPGGWLPLRKYMALDLGSGAAMRLLEEASGDTGFKYNTPVIQGAKLALLYSLINANGQTLFYKTGLATNQKLGTIVVDGASTVRTSAPEAADATFDASTEFSWTSPASNVVFMLQVTKQDLAAAGHNYFIFTATRNAKIPTVEGISAVPAGTNYNWTVKAINPVESMDAAATNAVTFADFDYAERVTFNDGPGLNTYNNNFIPKKADGFIASTAQKAIKSK